MQIKAICGLVEQILLEFLRAVRREGRKSCLLHYHGTSGLAQTREESVDTCDVLILKPGTATPNTFPEALAPILRILNRPLSSCF